MLLELEFPYFTNVGGSTPNLSDKASHHNTCGEKTDELFKLGFNFFSCTIVSILLQTWESFCSKVECKQLFLENSFLKLRYNLSSF